MRRESSFFIVMAVVLALCFPAEARQVILVVRHGETGAPKGADLRPLSEPVRTPQGLIVVVGCFHPGIEKILGAASKIDSHIYSVFGGFHLVDISECRSDPYGVIISRQVENRADGSGPLHRTVCIFRVGSGVWLKI